MPHIKAIITLFICLCSIFLFSGFVHADSSLEWDEQDILNGMNSKQFDEELEKFKQEYAPYFRSDEPWMNSAKNAADTSFSFKNILRAAIAYLFAEWIEQRYVLTVLFFLVILSSLVQQIQSNLEQSSITKLSNYIIYIVLFSFMVHSFYTVCMYGKNALEQMNGFMIALLPLLLSIVAIFGQILTISFFQPIVIFLIYASSTLITRLIFPLLFLAAILHLMSNLHESFQVTQLATVLRKISLYILGVFTSLFFGVLSIQGTLTSIGDGIAIKATKFMTSNFVPVIGRTMTEGVDTLLSASILAKNAIGMFGLIMLFLILLFPVIKMFAIAFMYQIVAACLQPIAVHPAITDSLEWMSKYMFYTLACILVMASLYFITLLLFIVATNIPLLVK